MTQVAKHSGSSKIRPGGSGWADRLVERLTHDVGSRLESDWPGKDKKRLIAIVKQALTESLELLQDSNDHSVRSLPVSGLKASDVISQGKVALSQATLYRAVEQGRFYCTTPSGRSIGKVFPAWQFVDPVPELIGSILSRLASLPSSEIHAFWVTVADELNELAPAEVLAGLPFETRGERHQSQQRLLDLPAHLRQEKVLASAAVHTRSMADTIG